MDCQWKGSCEKAVASLGYTRLPKDGECLEDVPKGPWAGDFTKNSGLTDRKKSELDRLRLSVVQRGCLRLTVISGSRLASLMRAPPSDPPNTHTAPQSVRDLMAV